MPKGNREKVLVPVERAKASAPIPSQTWDEAARRRNKPWYIIVLEGRECALFFMDRIHKLIKNDRVVEKEMQAALDTWLNQREVYRALITRLVTCRDIDDLEIPIGYYPEIVDRIKQEYKKIISK